ncbi:HD-GYP domain-containing protein [bacterium]|nr:HD-GYP domain-containing protein [bacterium]
MREGVVAALLEVLVRADNFTLTHSYRVAQLVVPMGVALHLSEDDLETLRVSALLHDLGKAFIPAQILLKQDFLTEEEFAVMRKHSEYGAAIVGRIPGFSDVRDIILAHHERHDGAGYPHGTAGADIPLGARILAVADSFDAMVTARVYRHGAQPDIAAAEVAHCAGSQFDPAVVDAFLITTHFQGVHHGDKKTTYRTRSIDRAQD